MWACRSREGNRSTYAEKLRSHSPGEDAGQVGEDGVGGFHHEMEHSPKEFFCEWPADDVPAAGHADFRTME